MGYVYVVQRVDFNEVCWKSVSIKVPLLWFLLSRYLVVGGFDSIQLNSIGLNEFDLDLI